MVWQACYGFGWMGHTLHKSFTYYFITVSYIPSIEAYTRDTV